MSKVELPLEEYEKMKSKINELEHIISDKNFKINCMENLLSQILSPFGEHIDYNVFRNIDENTRKTRIEYNPENFSYKVIISYEVKPNEQH